MKVPRPFAGSRKYGLVRLCAIALAQAGTTIATAFLVRHFFDAIVKAKIDWNSAEMGILAALLAVALARAWLRRSERIEAEALGQSYAHAVRLTLYDRLGSIAPRDLERRSRGGHLLRFIGDLSALRQWITLGLSRLTVATITTVAALAAFAFINVVLAASVAGVLLVGSFATLAVGRKLHTAMRESRRCRGRLAGDISERIALMSVVQTFSQVRRERGRIKRRSNELKNAMIALSRVVGTSRGLSQSVSGVALVVILAVGAHEVSHGRASVGAIAAAMSVLGMLTPALRDLGRVNEYWNAYKVASNRIRTFLEPQFPAEAKAPLPALPDGPGEVSFSGIVFGDVLYDVNVKARAGSVVAIVGPNGAGKSTLLSMVAGLIEPESGETLIDGYDIRQHRRSSIRAAIGVVSPDLPLMRGTIGRNIRYRSPNASDDEVRRVCTLCGIDELLAELPDGMDSRVVEGGLNLSPGQRQRVALARALLGKSRILLLDEVDANMDPESARLIDRILRTYPGTILFVSHRAELVMQADVVWHIQDGVIIEEGSPADLLAQDGPTRKLLSRSLPHAA